MTLTLYNTLTRRKEPFRPIDPGNVRMYVCGPTVYDFAHIGNARPVIVFDVLFRLLRHVYGDKHVTYARNITDVDDKINARAAEEYPDLPLNEAIAKVTEKTTRQFHEDVAALGVLTPTVEPRATEHIAEMRALCEALVAKGHAYVAQDHVLFDVNSMPDYGRLANRSLEEMEAGARVDVAPYKKGPMDFVLWKPSKQAGVDGSNYSEPGWQSPSGIKRPGRPGWHIECSAMAAKHLGESFDIHGGGIDLVFPHHENEIAQTRCAYGVKVMATNWMHNGFLQVEGEKMSKSLGNFVTIRELLATRTFGDRLWPGEVLRWAMLMTHYREPINWSVDRLTEARRELADFVESVVESPSNPYPVDIDDTDLPNSVVSALCDDLNTHAARTHLQLLHKQAVRGDQDAKRFLCRALVWLGIFRPAFNDAYSVSSYLASGKAWSGGKAPTYALIEKYREAMLDARAIVLNEYEWDTREHGRRLESRKKVEARINTLDARMPEDGVALELSEHCTVSLVPMRPETAVSKARVEELVAARNAARKARDFKEADRIRDELSVMGIQLKDARNPTTGEIETTWEVKR